jgi:hypothetical protein
MSKDRVNETPAELIDRLKRSRDKLQSRLDQMPPGRGAGLYLELMELDRRIKREELHSISGYRTPRRPVSGGAPGSKRRK